MKTKNPYSKTLRQRSKSLPTFGNIKNNYWATFGSKSTHTVQQQMRISSINSRKSNQNPKSQTDIPAVQRTLDEFEHILKNLQMTNSDLSELNVLMRKLRDIVSRFPRFVSLDSKKRNEFYETWDNLKDQALQKLNSQPNNYNATLNKLQTVKSNLENNQTKLANSNEIISQIEEIENKIKAIQNEPSQKEEVKERLKEIKSKSQNAKLSHDIEYVLLEFNKVEKKEKSKHILENNVQKTDKRLNDLIQRQPPTDKSSTKNDQLSYMKDDKLSYMKDDQLSYMKDDQSLSHISVNKKRSKSVSGFDSRSRMSRNSKISSKSFTTRQINKCDRKIKEIKSNSIDLNYEINHLTSKINKIEKEISNLHTQLDEIVEVNSIERTSLKKKLIEEIKKSNVAGCETYEQKEKNLSKEKANNVSLKQKLREIEKKEHEISDLVNRVREANELQSQIEEEHKRAYNLLDCLEKLTSDDFLNSRDLDGGFQVNLDNDNLDKEREEIRRLLNERVKSVKGWEESWDNSVGASYVHKLNELQENDIKVMYKRSESDSQYIANWKKELEEQLESLESEANSLKEESSLNDDGLNQLKEALKKWNTYRSYAASPEAKKKQPIATQIQINKMEIERLSKCPQEEKETPADVADLRNRNMQMIDWVKHLIEQAQEAASRQGEIKAQYNKTVKTGASNDMKKASDADKEMESLAETLFQRDKLKAECDDNNTNMQQLYEIMFDEQTDQRFRDLCPAVKQKIQKLVWFHRMKKKYNKLVNPDAEEEYSGLNLGDDDGDDEHKEYSREEYEEYSKEEYVEYSKEEYEEDNKDDYEKENNDDDDYA